LSRSSEPDTKPYDKAVMVQWTQEELDKRATALLKKSMERVADGSLPEPIPVRLMKYERRYGLLWSDATIQVGAGGPYLKTCDSGPLQVVTMKEFEDWLYDQPLVVATPGKKGRPKHLRRKDGSVIGMGSK